MLLNAARRGGRRGTVAVGDHTSTEHAAGTAIRGPRPFAANLPRRWATGTARPDAHRIQTHEISLQHAGRAFTRTRPMRRGVELWCRRKFAFVPSCSRTTTARKARNRARIDDRHRSRCGLYGSDALQPRWIISESDTKPLQVVMLVLDLHRQGCSPTYRWRLPSRASRPPPGQALRSLTLDGPNWPTTLVVPHGVRLIAALSCVGVRDRTAVALPFSSSRCLACRQAWRSFRR